MNAPIQGTVYPVLPLRDIVVFPGMIVPLFVGREKSVKALEEVMKDDKQILLIAQKNASQDDPGPDDIYSIGTLGTVLQLLKLPDDTVKVLVEGGRRVRVTGYTERADFFEARAVDMEEAPGETAELQGCCTHRGLGIRELREAEQEGAARGRRLDQQDRRADQARRHHLRTPGAEGRREAAASELDSVSKRLERILGLMEGEIGVLQVEKKIRNRVKRQMEKTQREYYLNEQMKAIQKELGETEDGRDEVSELEKRIKKTRLSKEAREKANAELKKLRTMSPMSAEATVVRNYLDWLLSIPVAQADQDHQGSQVRRGHSQRRPSRPREGEGAYPRVPRGPAARRQDEGADPVPRRTAGRRQDLAGQVDRQGDGP